MLHRVLSLAAALALVGFVGAVAAADKTDTDKSNSAVKGTLTKVSDESITLTDKDGKDHKMMLAKDAKITCDGKTCKAEDLKTGTSVTVTTKKDGDSTWATVVDARTEAKDK